MSGAYAFQVDMAKCHTLTKGMNNFEQVKIQTKQCALCYANEVTQKLFGIFAFQLKVCNYSQTNVCPPVVFQKKKKLKFQ